MIPFTFCARRAANKGRDQTRELEDSKKDEVFEGRRWDGRDRPPLQRLSSISIAVHTRAVASDWQPVEEGEFPGAAWLQTRRGFVPRRWAIDELIGARPAPRALTSSRRAAKMAAASAAALERPGASRCPSACASAGLRLHRRSVPQTLEDLGVRAQVCAASPRCRKWCTKGRSRNSW
jgi:hypothetical protein